MIYSDKIYCVVCRCRTIEEYFQKVIVMRIVIISDIHGNEVALQTVLRDCAQQGTFDQFIIAGDLCLYGPRPKEVIEIVQDLHCPVIQGNTDSEIAVVPKEDKRVMKVATIQWTV